MDFDGFQVVGRRRVCVRLFGGILMNGVEGMKESVLGERDWSNGCKNRLSPMDRTLIEISRSRNRAV